MWGAGAAERRGVLKIRRANVWRKLPSTCTDPSYTPKGSQLFPAILIYSVETVVVLGTLNCMHSLISARRNGLKSTTLRAKSSFQADVFQHPIGSHPTILYNRSNHSVSWGFNLQLIPPTEFTRKLPLFKMSHAGILCGDFSMCWTTGNGCSEKCPS